MRLGKPHLLLHKALVLLLFASVLCLPAAARAQDGIMPPDEDVEAITETLDAVIAAYLDGDGEAMDALTAENFVWIDASGEIYDRATWLDSASQGLFSELTPFDVTMNSISPDVVGVIMRLDGVGAWEDQEFAVFETDSLLFERTEGGWLLSFLHGTDRRAETEAWQAEAMREAMFAALPTLTIDVSEDGIVVPEEVPAGPTLIELTNSAGTMNEEGAPLVADVGVLVAEATMDDLMPLMAAAQDDPGPVLEMLKLYGTPIVPGGRIVWDLQPGENVAVTTAGEPMMQAFTVTEPEGDTAAMMADVDVHLVDFAFAMPDEVASGPQVWQITNAGSQWHEIVVLKLQEGMTTDDLLAMFAGEGGPPAEEDAAAEGTAGDEDTAGDEAEVGASEAMTDTAEAGAAEEEAAGPPADEMPFEMIYGYVALSEGNTAWVEVDLPPGEYTVICFLPDLLGDMAPHATHGMVTTLVVNE